jgi:uncharacterized protein
LSYKPVELLEMVLKRYRLSAFGTHGVSHWARVLENGRRLAKLTAADIEVVELFAIFHDSCRVNESLDPGHGRRGAELAQMLRGQLFSLNDLQFDQLVYACANHTKGMTEADVTVQVCWDADRLDLGRVWIRPICERLCTVAACGDDILAWAEDRSRLRARPELIKNEWDLELPAL